MGVCRVSVLFRRHSRTGTTIARLCFLVFFLVVPRTQAMGQSYTGSVLYPLTAPPGITSVNASNNTVTYGTIASVHQMVGWGAVTSTTEHALLWSAAGVVDLNPTNLPGFSTSSLAFGNSGSQQVGYGYGTAGADALLWNGTADSAVDLNPASVLEGVSSSRAFGTDGIQQVGSGVFQSSPRQSSPIIHAFLWTGTAASVVDLDPTSLSGIQESEAYAINGSQQVGRGWEEGEPEFPTHALLWSATAASAVDLNPTDLTGITSSSALGTDGTQQVGYGDTVTGYTHSLLWNGTAASAVDLNPTDLSGITYSVALSTNGIQQVGWGFASSLSNDEALLWTGTADSAVDLQALLPSTGTWTDSVATTIDSSGNVYGTADGTYNNVTGTFAVEWSVPEPGTGSLLLFGSAGILVRRRRK